MEKCEQISEKLIEKYRRIRAHSMPMWAVHKITPDMSNELIVPTIPFIGKHYAEQSKKILVYASAETLNNYCYGEENSRIWLDDDIQAENRHRKCFDDSIKDKNIFFPNVHISPMNDGALATAVMYLASLINNRIVEEPRRFYETIAIGNYGKFSIETEYQYQVRNNPKMTDNEKKMLKKEKGNRNKDYADDIDYLMASHDYIRADIETLRPDYIIMPKVEDGNFLDSIIGADTKKIEIYQMTSMVVNLGTIRKNKHSGENTPRNYESLPEVIQQACKSVKGVNLTEFSYLFDYLDKKCKNI